MSAAEKELSWQREDLSGEWGRLTVHFFMGAFGKGQWREPYVGGDEGGIRIMVRLSHSNGWRSTGHFPSVHVATRTFSLLHAMLPLILDKVTNTQGLCQNNLEVACKCHLQQAAEWEQNLLIPLHHSQPPCCHQELHVFLRCVAGVSSCSPISTGSLWFYTVNLVLHEQTYDREYIPPKTIKSDGKSDLPWLSYALSPLDFS